MPRAINSAINLDSREQLLLRAHQSSASTGYDWVNVSCLTAGFILIIKLGKDDVLPRDGYGWMDEEASKGVFLVNGRQIEVFERKLGFSGEDKVVSMTRTRTRIIDPMLIELNLIHYLAADQSFTTPVWQNLVKEKPESWEQTTAKSSTTNQGRIKVEVTAAQQQAQQQSFLMQQQKAKQMAKDVQAMQAQNAYGQARGGQGAPQQQAQMEFDSIGDLHDITTPHTLAGERFKRNLGLLEEIFSTDITPPSILPAGVSINNVEELKKKLADKEKLIEDLKVEHKEKASQFQVESVEMWKCIAGIQKIDKNEGDITAVVEKLTGKVILPGNPRVRRHEIAPTQPKNVEARDMDVDMVF